MILRWVALFQIIMSELIQPLWWVMANEFELLWRTNITSSPCRSIACPSIVGYDYISLSLWILYYLRILSERKSIFYWNRRACSTLLCQGKIGSRIVFSDVPGSIFPWRTEIAGRPRCWIFNVSHFEVLAKVNVW
jgi:hypothetical protein